MFAGVSSIQLPPLLLQGDSGSYCVDLDNKLRVCAAAAAEANFASRPAGLAIIVRSLSSPSLSLRNANEHSSYSDIVLSGRPRAGRGGAMYVEDGR